MSDIVNGAPQTYFDGIKDESTRALVPEALAVPSLLTKIYLYLKDGPITPQLVGGNAAQLMYDAESFSPDSPYFNHATFLANKIFSAPSKVVVQRVRPDDAGPKASLRLYLDVLYTQIPTYERETDGSVKLDEDGHPIPTGTTISGAKLKWVLDYARVVQGVSDLGQATITNGDQVDQTSNTQSRRIPIFDAEVPHFGGKGNHAGLRLWAPTNTGLNPMDARILTEEKFYPFNIACLRRKDELSTPRLVETTRATQSVLVSLKPNAIFRKTATKMYAGSQFIPAYQTLQHPTNPPQWGPFGTFFLYQDNIDDLLDELYRLEAPVASEFSDFGTAVDDATVDASKYLYNLISGVSSANVPYESVQWVTTGDFVHLSSSSVIYAQGGSDGTMSNEKFAELVSASVAEYNNPNSLLLDTARNPENLIVDSGFPLQTKYDLLNFIAIRKDTMVGLSTHDADGPPLTSEQETSSAVAIATRARLFPESTFYGTATARAFVMARSGIFLNTEYDKPLPVLIDTAYKYAQYMGADDGRWKPGYSPEDNPRNIVDSMRDFNITFTPSSVRQNDWMVGMNWLQSYDLNKVFVPAYKTVYTDDTSVLNSVTTMFACSRLQRIGEGIWRDYTGRTNLTKAQLRQLVEAEVLTRTNGLFDDRFVFRGEVVFTKDDEARGYSWHLNIHIYANNMITVQTLSVIAHRMEDLEATA